MASINIQSIRRVRQPAHVSSISVGLSCMHLIYVCLQFVNTWVVVKIMFLFWDPYYNTATNT